MSTDADVAPLPTPHAPGFLPDTPLEGSTTVSGAGAGFRGDEGILEQPGRELSTNDTKAALGGALLGSAVGLVLGGPVGAVLGGGLGGLGSLENEGLKAKLRDDDTATTSNSTHTTVDNSVQGLKQPLHVDSDARQPIDLGKTPALKEVEQAQGSDAARELAHGGLLAGASGAIVADRELEEPATIPTTNTSSAANDLAQPTRDLSLDEREQPLGQAARPIDEGPKVEEHQQEGLDDKSKIALGAGAGLAAGGLGGAAFASSRNKDVTPASSPTPGKPNLAEPSSSYTAPAIPSTFNPYPQEAIQPQPITQTQPAVPPQPTVQRAAGTSESAAAPLASSNLDQSQLSQLHTADKGAEQRNDLKSDDLKSDDHNRGAEAAAGAALGAAGAVGAVEAVRAAGSSKDDVDMSSANNLDPAAALAAQLGGKASRLMESTLGLQADKCVPTQQHVSSGGLQNASVTDGSTEHHPALEPSSADEPPVDDPVVEALATKGFDAQRAIVPQDPSFTSNETLKIDPQDLRDSTATGVVPGFSQPANGPHSTAFDDFAHLSQPTAANQQAGAGTVPTTTEATAGDPQLQIESHHGRDAALLGGGALAGAVGGTGLAAAYAAEHGQIATGGGTVLAPGASETAPGAAAPVQPQGTEPFPQQDQSRSSVSPAAMAAAVPAGAVAGAGVYGLASRRNEGPAGNNQQKVFPTGSGFAGTSTPTSTRAVRGSPTPPTSSGVFGSESSQRQSPAANYATSSPDRGFVAGPTAPLDGRPSYDNNEGHSASEFHLHPDNQDEHQSGKDRAAALVAAAGLSPVEKSPHMKIQTRKDPEGHKRLHKKSLGDPLAAGGSGESGEDSGRDSLDSRSERRDHNSAVPVAAAAGLGTAAAGAGGAHVLHRRHHDDQGPHDRESATHGGVRDHEGQNMWNQSVAHVVDDETVHRGGHRPELVGDADSSSRRSSVMDRVVGVPDPSYEAHGSHSPKWQHHGKVIVDESGHKKLHRHRRGSSAAGEEHEKSSGGLFSRFSGRRGSKSSHKSEHSAGSTGHAQQGAAAAVGAAGAAGAPHHPRHSTEHARHASSPSSPRMEPGEARISSEIPPVPGVTVPFDESEMSGGALGRP
ncbi:hypothetical protein OIO90_005785 [Microbotryomycetes sp. JL221]|nr:hypothetical protein OIO90_005785 [Microbotryomycetes sp. JL221]